MKHSHGLTIEEWLEMWEAQDGCCYLCGDNIDPTGESAVIDHDHSCCPRNKSCAKCRRGIACHRCNRGIGFFNDSAELMRRVADNLETVLLKLEGE